MNATFKWIQENLKDDIDFVVWTGDSARHDSDEEIPRGEKEVLATNRYVVDKFAEVFGTTTKSGASPEFEIPIIPTFGNNDILPHNILVSGPNKWLKAYTQIWNKFIPEEQRHGFERGGWYYVEVIPNKLAVFSLNTLYFFSNNAGTDGCGLKSEPGYEHMEWLRVQLGFMRERGMKAILMGHVPPARTDSKKLWDETCWQKYTLWLSKYRDVVVGGFYGHMNIDHFMLQDVHDVKVSALEGSESDMRVAMEEEIGIESAKDYLAELREDWSKLPKKVLKLGEAQEKEEDLPVEDLGKKHKKKKNKKKKNKKTGGPWGERFQVSVVAPSIVPNYFPTLRVVEYNITGLDPTVLWSNTPARKDLPEEFDWLLDESDVQQYIGDEPFLEDEDVTAHDNDVQSDKKSKKKKGKKGKKGKKKPKNPDLEIPDPPAKTSPPGPAYSPQTLTLLGYTQYFANLTHINNVPHDDEKKSDIEHSKSKAKPKPHPKEFKFEVEYDTFTDEVYRLEDMTVPSYLKLAYRIGQEKPLKGDEIATLDLDGVQDEDEDVENDDVHEEKSKKKKKKDSHELDDDEKNKVWIEFYNRAFVSTIEDKRLAKSVPASEPIDLPEELHDGEL